MYLKRNLVAVLVLILFTPFIILAQSSSLQKLDSVQVLIDKARKVKDFKTLQNELSEIASIYEYDGNWEKYDEVIDEMISLAKKLDDNDYMAECYNKMGISNCYRGANEKAIIYFEKALAINLEENDSGSISNSYENIGLVYKDMGLFDKALQNQLKSIEIREKIKHSRLVNNYANISTIYKMMEEYDMEAKYTHMAVNELEKSTKVSPSNSAIIYNQLGHYYDRKGDQDSGIFCYEKVIEFSKLANWKRGIATGKGNIAIIYSDRGELDLSISLHREVLQLSIEIDDCMGIVEELSYLAKLYEMENQLDSALYFSKKSLEKSYACDLGKDKMNILEQHSLILEKLGDNAGALEYYKKFHALSDSLFNTEKREIVADLETKYQTEKKEQKISQLSAENELERERIKLAFVTIVAIVLAALFIIFWLNTRRRKAKEEQEVIKQQLFRSQMNPHFIFNALASIQNYLYKNQPKIAANYLGNFSSLTRSVLINSTKETISLEEEIETLKNYIELEKMRTKNAFSYELKFQKELETEFINIPPMLIQPFIENAIKHGLNGMEHSGKLSVSFEDKEQYLKVLVEDDGIGINEAQKSKEKGHESKALSIFKQRMQIISKNNKKLPQPVIMDLSAEGKHGTAVELYLPILN